MALLALVSRLGPGRLVVADDRVLVAVDGRRRWRTSSGTSTRRAPDPAARARTAPRRRPVDPRQLSLRRGFLSLDTYVPLYVQGGRGGGATAAAGVVTPVMLTWALSGMVAAPLLVRWGFRRTAVARHAR